MYMLNVKEFGAIGNGKADDTKAFKKAFDKAYETGGGSVYIPKGTYLIQSAIKIDCSFLTLKGEGKQSHIIYTYEQKDNDTQDDASLFVFKEGVNDICIKNLKLEYKGYFYPKFGESYKGKSSAILFRQCNDILVENVEACGFNASGIKVSTGDPLKYARRFKVWKCYLHHNRVAGVLFGYVDGISITDCDLEYQGSPLDGGTGYGLAGSSGELPKNIQIKGNRAYYNYRKGIDLHAGIGAIIEGNICHGNRLYGIYTEGRKTGNVIIKGNIISGMKRKNVGIPEPYTWIAGIDFGPFSGDLVPEEYHNYIIEGNQILDFGLDQQSAYPMRCYYNFQKGMVQIKNNIFKTYRTDFIIGFISGVKEKRDVKADISGNQVFAGEVTGPAFYLPYIKDLNLSFNRITIDKSGKKDFIHFGKESPEVFSFVNNSIMHDGTNSLFNGNIDKNGYYCSGNFVNGMLQSK